MNWFLYHLDTNSLVLDKIDLEPHHDNWVNNNHKAIFPKMKKGDTLIATQKDMPISVFNWELSLYCQNCNHYHCKYEECK